MAKRIIQDYEWGKIMNQVKRGASLITEAEKFGMTREELVAQGDQKYSRNSRQWEECKRLSEKREKKQTLKKKSSVVPLTLASASTPVPDSEIAPTSAPATDLMEELLLKKEKLQRQNADCASSLEEAKAILSIRQGALTDAQAVLAKAQQAVQQATADVEETETCIRQAQTELAKVQGEIQQVEQEIQKLREKIIYLVDPWFNGEFPAFGTFLSTVEMEGVQVLKPVETIEPDFKDMVSSGFDLVSEYTRALSFVSLVQEYILKGEAHSVLNTDPRVKKLLYKHIG